MVLLVGGDRQRRSGIRVELTAWSVTVVESDSPQAALTLLRDAAFDAVLVHDDPRQLALRGLLGQLKRNTPATKVFLLHLESSQPEALKGLAPEAIQVPFELDPEQLARMVRQEVVSSTDQTPPPASRPAMPLDELPTAENTPPMPSLDTELVLEKSKVWDLARGNLGPRPVLIARLADGPASDPELGASFLRLGNLASKLDHPSLPKTLYVGAEPRPAVAYEVAPGTSLSQLRRKLYDADRWPSPRCAALIACEILGALEPIHDAKMIHGGLAPRWIWIEAGGGVKLLGAGIGDLCRQIEETMRSTIGLSIPNPYLAPEQVSDKVSDSKSDLFVLGALLYELLSGDPLFLRDDAFHTYDAIVACKVPDLDRSVPAAIAEVCQSCLARDPDARPRSAAAAKAALLAALEAPPGPAQNRGLLGKLLGRNRSDTLPIGGGNPRSELAELARLAA